MAKSKQEFLDAITNIGTCEDETQRREMLAELHTDAGELFDTNATLETSNKNLTDDNEKLREANMKLFLRVGDPENKDTGKNRTGVEHPEEKRKFEDLFDEKGGLK